MLTVAFVLIAALCSLGDARTVSVTPNPGCGAVNCTEMNLRLLQVTTANANDQIIYLLSAFGPPTLLTAHFNSPTTASCKVDWICMVGRGDNCVTFNIPPAFTSSIVFYRLIEYNDMKDTHDASGFYFNPESVRNTYFADIEWTPVSAKGYDKPSWSFYLNATNDNLDLVNVNASGYIELDFQFFNDQSRTPIMPKISHTDSAGMFDLTLSDLTLHFNQTKGVQSSRFAFEIVTVSDALPMRSSVSSVASVDDEYSPGVFDVVTWTMNSDATSDNPSSYVHYKPVSYTKLQRNLESIQPARVSNLRFFNYDDFSASGSLGLVQAYYGTTDNVRLRNVHSANISIGAYQDGFYTAYNFTTFTGVYGVGQPVFDSMSISVISAIAVGVGVPAVLIVAAVTVVIVRMVRKRKEDKANLLVNE